MSHDIHIEAQLPAYLDGRLDRTAHARVSAHLAACAACARAADAYRAVERVLDQDEAASPLGPMWPAIARRRDPVRRRVADLGFALAAAAALSAGFMLGVLAVNDGATTDAPRAAAATDAEWLASEPTLSDVYFFETANGTEDVR